MTAWVAGVDGCKAGWIAVLVADAGATEIVVTPRFADILAHRYAPSIIAVDMPIGLPDRVGPGGRGPERLVRAKLGNRQSSVFAIPPRSAVMAESYAEATSASLEASTPPRKVSRQAFGLFPKIREIDALMTPALEDRLYESHPELAFWALNGQRPMALPKKARGVPHPAGLNERRALLIHSGYDAALLSTAPRGAGPDDVLDAAVLALIARRIAGGKAESFPSMPERDAKGLRMAIWA
ncbi:Predicted nuclease (RNAse H fold) [Kaistia soli DSM 19436]|uniref:Predicted nuclease (RNAse H fold) n=1 Tax=Kaistia soli DSM 19436 TaxID=1122133 RepID=A0A1M5CDB2_9HYPH|nr:DUF429 domain-containing protein [Kaistia soli]SHF52656.1 Predicted nuclease (RNAse H fold) [Kaistia soli DSM 19436]